MVTDVKNITTAKLAELLGCKPDTVRRSLCTKGHYLGIRPVKLPNNRLMWPLKDVAQILNSGGQGEYRSQ